MTAALPPATAGPDPPPVRVPGRGWTILLISLMVAACLLALVATALYLTGTFITPAPIPDFTR